jgi:hypothetical protein
VVHLETHFIHEHLSATQVVRSRGDAKAFERIDELHAMFRAYDRTDATRIRRWWRNWAS